MKRRQRKARLPAARLRELGVSGSVDPRTIARVYAGEDVRGLAGDRARDVLRAAGLLLEERQ
jgi:hypothetical protein